MNRKFACIGLVAIAGIAFASEEGEYDKGDMGATLNVPGDFPTIQEAIDNAVSGDTILVAGGTYGVFDCDVDNLTIIGNDVRPLLEDTDALKVDARDFVDNTRPNCESLVVIDGMDADGSTVSGSGVTIVGFSFINGKDAHNSGGALEITGSASIAYCCFVDNKADEDGGAIYVAPNASLSVANSIFDDNSADFGGAIEVRPNATLSVVDCDFLNNLADGTGGAIDMVAAASVTIEASCFQDNAAERNILGQGGAIYNFVSPLTIKNSVFCGNSAFQGGGAIFSQDGDNDIFFCTFWNNTSISGGGLEQEASPSTGSAPAASFNIWNSVMVFTGLVNNVRGLVDGDGDEATRMNLYYSFTDEDISTLPRVRDIEGNLELDALQDDTTVFDLFEDPTNCNFNLVCDPCTFSNPLIDSGDSTACQDLFFDKNDDCRATDKVDNPSSAFIDEGMPNTGISIFNRNCTCDAVDMGAYEFQPAAFEVIGESCEGDADFDGDVDIDDIFVVLRKFGYPCVLPGCEVSEYNGHDSSVR